MTVPFRRNLTGKANANGYRTDTVQNGYDNANGMGTEWIQNGHRTDIEGIQNRYKNAKWNMYRTDTERISNGYRMVTGHKKEKSVL